MIEFEISGGGLDRLSRFLNKGPEQITAEFRKAVLYTESVIKKDFMSIEDGSLKYITSKGQRVYDKRAKFPGVRASTGTLRRSVKSEFRVLGNSLEGAIGTNLEYGRILDRNPKYEFLVPGVEKAMPEIEKMLNVKIASELNK